MATTSATISETEPFHPGRKFIFPKRRFGARERSCQAQWFIDFPFLHYDVDKDVVFCHTCLTAVEQKKILHSKHPDAAFVSNLFFTSLGV